MSQRKGGPIQLQIAGVLYDAKGDFTYNLGHMLRSPIIGADSVHGWKETPQVAFIEGEVTDRGNLDLASLVTAEDITVTIELANGKAIVLSEAVYAGEGTGNTGEGNIMVRFEGKRAQEVAL